MQELQYSDPTAAAHSSPRTASKPRTGLHGLVGTLLVVGAFVAVVVIWWRFWHRESAEGNHLGQRIVSVARPTRATDTELTVPANIDAFQTTLLYARISGYLLKWHADIGDRVKQGDKLAEIDTPDADRELDQARANLVQGKADLETANAEQLQAEAAVTQAEADIVRAKANLAFAASALGRTERLVSQKMVTAQDLDESRRDAEARQADVDAATAQLRTRQAAVTTAKAKVKSRQATIQSLEAILRRHEELQEFKVIRAPFDGIVTRRRAEVGILVTAGGIATAQELFAVAQADRLRIRIQVPQSQAAGIAAGQSAQVRVPEYPGRVFNATVARTARAIDPSTRTLMVELELPNTDQKLTPGAFAQVMLSARRTEPAWTIPATSLINRGDGTKVAVVDSQGIVHFRLVTLGRDYGKLLEVLTGLRGDEQIVLNPPDTLADAEHVGLADAQGPQGPAVAAHEGKSPRS